MSAVKHNWKGKDYHINELAEIRGESADCTRKAINTHGVDKAMARPQKRLYEKRQKEDRSLPMTMEYETDRPLKNFLHSLKAMGLSDSEMEEQIAKRLAF